MLAHLHIAELLWNCCVTSQVALPVMPGLIIDATVQVSLLGQCVIQCMCLSVFYSGLCMHTHRLKKPLHGMQMSCSIAVCQQLGMDGI